MSLFEKALHPFLAGVILAPSTCWPGVLCWDISVLYVSVLFRRGEQTPNKEVTHKTTQEFGIFPQSTDYIKTSVI